MLTFHIRPLSTALAVALMLGSAAGGYALGRPGTPTPPDDRIGAYIADHPEQIEKIIGNYLHAHPEALTDMIGTLIRKEGAQAPAKQPAAETAMNDRAAGIASNAAALFDSPHQVTLGDPRGDVALVEFFDYNCGFCKRALADTLTLLDGEPRLKIVLKEYPILGQDSIEAARVAIALRMQDRDGVKYLAFHRELLSGHGPADRRRALDVARAVGADMKRIERDSASKEVSDTLEETMRLGSVLKIDGTPSYVVGKEVLAGAVGSAELSDHIRVARR